MLLQDEGRVGAAQPLVGVEPGPRRGDHRPQPLKAGDPLHQRAAHPAPGLEHGREADRGGGAVDVAGPLISAKAGTGTPAAASARRCASLSVMVSAARTSWCGRPSVRATWAVNRRASSL
ncbi:hypothetical protein GCM10027610_091640 [Dactylosporangium cerinum]